LDHYELIERWTLIGDDLERMASKRSAAKLGFALLMKFFAAHGRFPCGHSELPSAALEFVAKQLRVPASDQGFYDWSGRSIERHRAEIREALGFRECSVADADKLTDWLVTKVTQSERRADQVRADQATARARAHVRHRRVQHRRTRRRGFRLPRHRLPHPAAPQSRAAMTAYRSIRPASSSDPVFQGAAALVLSWSGPGAGAEKEQLAIYREVQDGIRGRIERELLAAARRRIWPSGVCK